MKFYRKLKFRHFVGKLTLKKPRLFPFANRIRDAIRLTMRPYRSHWGVNDEDDENVDYGDTVYFDLDD